ADANPAKPADANPAKPADANPAKPADANPAKPADANPAKPADAATASKKQAAKFDPELVAFPHMTGLAIEFDRAVLARQNIFYRLHLNGWFQQDKWQKLLLTATQDQKSQLAIEVKPVDDHREVTVTSDNMGGLLSAFGISDNLVGGKISITGRMENNKWQSKYHVTMTDYRIVKAPVMARILAVVSIASIPDLMAGNGIVFQDLNADLTRNSKGWEIDGLLAQGSSLGMSLEGSIHGRDRKLNLNGTVVPLYGLSKLVGSIPVFGQLLTGGAAGGIFAWSFSLRGKMDNPVVSVNPLSALAPGFLRSLIERLQKSQPLDEEPTPDSPDPPAPPAPASPAPAPAQPEAPSPP
ncbi:MAG: AsmA-like C-terminal domain-containing protein, partial [Candidatus Symbiobacter sp.]|nr:AsmA-like C-terminal domain-containing protein [Candidatus Symbiobacter sp.]